MNQINYYIPPYHHNRTDRQPDEIFNVNDDKINAIFKIYFPSFITCETNFCFLCGLFPRKNIIQFITVY